MTDKEKMMAISEKLGSKLLGMSGTKESMTFVLEGKEVVVKNYGSKSVDEIVKEIEEIIEEISTAVNG